MTREEAQKRVTNAELGSWDPSARGDGVSRHFVFAVARLVVGIVFDAIEDAARERDERGAPGRG